MAIQIDYFDNLRSKVKSLPGLQDHKGGDHIKALFLELIGNQEMLWNKLTAAEIDITKHDEHGAVAMED